MMIISQNDPQANGSFWLRGLHDRFQAITLRPITSVKHSGTYVYPRSIIRAESLGDMISWSAAMPKFAVSGVGLLAYFKDTDGNLVEIMQMDKEAKS